MVVLGAALTLALALGQDSGAKASLERVPADLPRAEVGHWEGLLDGDGAEHFAQFADPAILPDVLRAEQLYAARRYPEVVATLWGVLEAEPDFPPALTVLGTTYFRLRRYGDTAECFERFLVHAPEHVWRTQALGHAYHSLGRFEQAIAHYDQVLGGVPDSTEAIRGRALANLRLGRYDEARAGLARVLEVDPDHVEALCELADLNHGEGELELARTQAERARDLAPWEPRPWFLLTRLLFELGLEDESSQAQERWRELDALTQSIRSLEGRLSYGEDRYSIAMQLTDLYRRTGDTEGARRALDVVIDSIPPEIESLDVYLFALDTFLELGDREAAYSAASAIETTFADRMEAWRALERFYASQRDRERQIKAAERALRLGSPNDF